MSNDLQKAQMGAKTFQLFCEQFGEDIYAQILLEELLEGIMNEETVFVFGEQEQEGHQVDNDSSGGVSGDLEDHGLEHPQTPADLGEKDPTDHL